MVCVSTFTKATNAILKIAKNTEFEETNICIEPPSYKEWNEMLVKKEFIGPGLHLRPVCADREWPLLQWTLNSVLRAVGMAMEG